jgi:O-antigen/teichoic acid export membrane protein
MRANVRWTAVGNAAYGAGQWVQFVILARLGGAAAVGAYAYALALTAPVMMLAYLQLRTLLATDVHGTHPFREYRRLRLATTGAALLVVGAMAGWSGASAATWSVLVPVCAMRAADALADLYYAAWQRQERMGVIGGGLVLQALCQAAFMGLAAAAGGGAPAAAAGAALGSAVGLAFVVLRTHRDRELRATLPGGPAATSWRSTGRLAVEAAPLGVIVLLGSLQQNVPRYFLQHAAGDAALGIFAAASQLTAAGTIVVGALGGAAMPRLARLCAAGDAPGFRLLARRLVLGAALLGAAGVALSLLVGRQVLVLLFRPEFAAGAGALVVLSLAAGVGFVATLLGYVLTAARVIAVQPVLLAAALGVIVASCQLLVPARGAAGAAWALVAGALVQALASAAALSRFRLGAPAAPQAASAGAS